MYLIIYTHPDIAYSVGVLSHYCKGALGGVPEYTRIWYRRRLKLDCWIAQEIKLLLR